MNCITRLDTNSARKISAGQVITDVSSVLKELVENAIDADATHVTIRLERFGLDCIEVEDNGSGVPLEAGVTELPEGAPLMEKIPLLNSRASTKRTSTRSSTSDLPPTPTSGSSAPLQEDHDNSSKDQLGFRGEALHSLAQLSTVTLTTMHANTMPHTVELTQGPSQPFTVQLHQQRQTCGTTVRVAQLFQHLPVRRKELEKHHRRQLTQAVQLLKQYALSHPGLRLLLLHQEDPPRQSAWVTLLSLSGSNDLVKAVSEAYGGATVLHQHAVQWWCPPFGEVTGLLADLPQGGRLNKDRQVLALDGRLVDLPSVSKALQDAFTQSLPNASQKLQVSYFLNIHTLSKSKEEEKETDDIPLLLSNRSQGSSSDSFNLSNTDNVQYDVNLAPNKRKVLFANVEQFAQMIHGHALQDFQRAAERSDTSPNSNNANNAAARQEQQRIQLALLEKAEKERRKPVSATAFTQYAFKSYSSQNKKQNEKEKDAVVTQWALDRQLLTPQEAQTAEESKAVGVISAQLMEEDDGEKKKGRKRSREEDESREDETDMEEILKLEENLTLSSEVGSDKDDDDEEQQEEEEEKGEESTTKEENNHHNNNSVHTNCGLTPNKEEEEAGDHNNDTTINSVEAVADTPLSSRPSGLFKEGVTLPCIEHILPSNNTNNEKGCCPSCSGHLPSMYAFQAEESTIDNNSKKKHKKKDIQEQNDETLGSLFEKQSFRDLHIIGQFNHGFILATLNTDHHNHQNNSLLFIIDQHASDEIYNYERHKKSYKARPQILVSPVVVSMDVGEVQLALEHAATLREHGFLVKEATKENTPQDGELLANKLLVCSVPVLPYDTVLPTDVLELIQQLVTYHSIQSPLKAVWHSLATKACRQSIMIGTALNLTTMRNVVHRLAELEKPWNCPHGRPTLRCLGTVGSYAEELQRAASAGWRRCLSNKGEETEERVSPSGYYYGL
ncbi:DNA mismatch repair protein PMS2 [Angomonas deanei]|uniref:Histidine kinase-, DNA gyrase B-, and HSP90-like ATPase/MutL C terminal dimerisation domain containing protein, putative n=1 Tax=Angomonas deanei TaxID=59799 RepID=A0A7G2CDH2_9TRYP|nr:DNA mismatch repair protein PMS2 [Angomonas deanei]CAD2216894.1 Histidine kinase-, DNA gyrase B-, and HSP90-like ATPase/MutL C terminal dimerisation domain containing protein, putative [Angomonas deanei]|eukprot:EPY18372.1 DNA mismatch repair protein PMS2 [Angomonas deanei]